MGEHPRIDVTVDAGDVRQLGAYGEPGRDPRNRTISIAHLVELDVPAEAAGASDASDARWRPVRELLDDELAFDHATILRDGLSASRWGGR